MVTVAGADTPLPATPPPSTTPSTTPPPATTPPTAPAVTQPPPTVSAAMEPSVKSGDSAPPEDGGEEELPNKRELEQLILGYMQPIHRQLADLRARLDAVEEKLGEGS